MQRHRRFGNRDECATKDSFSSQLRQMQLPTEERLGFFQPGPFWPFGVKESALAIGLGQWDNDYMKIAIELNAAQTERLQEIAESLGVNAEELAQAAVADLISADAPDFEAAASRVLQKNRDLYRRLAK
jgi:hypothetical protein